MYKCGGILYPGELITGCNFVYREAYKWGGGGALISDSLRYTSFDHTTSFNVLLMKCIQLNQAGAWKGPPW